VLWDAVEQLGVVAAPFAVAALVPWRRTDPACRALALAGAAYVLIVAVSSQAGFAGNPRYLVPAEALFCVLAGVGAARFGLPLAVALAAALAITQAGHIGRDLDSVAWRADQREQLDVVIARAGGAQALEACGRVQSGNYWRALVASRLDADIAVVARPQPRPRVLVRGPAEDSGAYEPAQVPPGLERRIELPDWEIWTACRGL